MLKHQVVLHGRLLSHAAAAHAPKKRPIFQAASAFDRDPPLTDPQVSIDDHERGGLGCLEAGHRPL